MKKRFLSFLSATLLAAGLMLMPHVSQGADDGGLPTLRGKSIAAPDNFVTGEGMKQALETDPIERNFLDQPPLVSHAVDDYPITIRFNKCLDCHSVENYRKEKATRISATHFEDANGKKLAGVSSRRYFCVQCHVPQVDAKPLIANTFQPALTR